MFFVSVCGFCCWFCLFGVSCLFCWFCLVFLVYLGDFVYFLFSGISVCLLVVGFSPLKYSLCRFI